MKKIRLKISISTLFLVLAVVAWMFDEKLFSLHSFCSTASFSVIGLFFSLHRKDIEVKIKEELEDEKKQNKELRELRNNDEETRQRLYGKIKSLKLVNDNKHTTKIKELYEEIEQIQLLFISKNKEIRNRNDKIDKN